MQNDNIIRLVMEKAREHPGKTAIIDCRKGLFGSLRHKPYSFSRLIDDVGFASARLKELGFTQGDRIVVFVPMSYDLYVIVLGIFAMGGVAVFIDAWADRKRLSDACRVVAPRGFIGSPKAQILRLVPEIRKIPRKLVHTTLMPRSGISVRTPMEPAQVPTEGEALVTLTTGSTGLPKGAKRTSGFLFEQLQVLGKHFHHHGQTVDLTVLPIFVLMNLALGVTSVLPAFNPATPTRFDPGLILRQMRETGVTSLVGSPAFLDKITDHLLKNNERLPLETLYTGGAPVFKPLARKLKQAFPHTRMEVVYGSTEAEPISSARLEDAVEADPDLGLLVGRKDAAVEVKVLKPVSGPLAIEPGKGIDDYAVGPTEVGEIVVSGKHVLRDYIASAEAFRENKIVDGDRVWHRTGDAGLLDSGGNVRLHGRVKEPIHSNGAIVYALPYEQKLMEIPGIAFAAVIEVGDRIIAVIEPGSEHQVNDQDILLEKAMEALQGIQAEIFLLMKRIPRDPRHGSKVDFNTLKGLLEKLGTVDYSRLILGMQVRKITQARGAKAGSRGR